MCYFGISNKHNLTFVKKKCSYLVLWKFKQLLSIVIKEKIFLTLGIGNVIRNDY